MLRGFVAGVVATVASALGLGAPVAAAAPAASSTVEVYATYYGWYDNTPPGCATAYSGCAGGTGTYADPITFASDRAEFPVGTVLYYPLVRKYFRMGDDCQECGRDWRGHGPNGGPHFHHVDLWIGGQGGNERRAIDCEDALTRSAPSGGPLQTSFVVDPPPGLRVSAQPLFDTATGRCFGGATASSTVARYQDGATGTCLDDPAARPGAPATLAPCTGRSGTSITYRGAFLQQGGACLRTTGRQVGWAACDGGPGEQWEVNPNGTITWVQYTRCLAPSGSSVVLAACTGAPDQSWTALRPARG